ncbi:efflux RND transporter periplasmic adaptor subunit [Methylobacterium oryzisoli]|uniref:efflux RND transporter periplasmic adaptor subunit n=1 Tax=Methylobacterium oryzisoli TaxID=3385502 RepID=UPI0038921155
MDVRSPPETDAPPTGRPRRWLVLTGLAVAAGLGIAVAVVPQLREAAATLFAGWQSPAPSPKGEAAASAPAGERVFRPTRQQRASFGIRPIATANFRPADMAEGRIALNEDNNVPVAAPYAGRVTKVLARAGEEVRAGDILLRLEAADMVQAQNDYQAALNTLQKQQALLKLDQTIAARQQELFAARAVALKDYQSAQNDVIAAQSDLRTAEAAADAARNRLRLLGKSDAEIASFEKSGRLGSEVEIRAPIAGTIVQRKVGVGQYLSSSSDPAFVIGDLSTVWLIANVRESEVPQIRLGQPVEARVTGFGDRVFKARVDYMAASLDPATRRLAVRSEVENPDRVLRPEMFAAFTIITGPVQPSPAVPLAAIVYEGADAHVWIARPDGTIAARRVRIGLIDGDTAQVVEGVEAGEQIVTRGALFIDRAASGDKAS